jgi:hypothetical protein
MAALTEDSDGGDDSVLSPPSESARATSTICGEGGGGGIGAALGGVDGGPAGIVGVTSGSELSLGWTALDSHVEPGRA